MCGGVRAFTTKSTHCCFIASIGDMDVFGALDAASKATEQLNKQVNIDKMEEMLEKLED